MKLLSYNFALRPLMPNGCPCEPDYHLYNAHEPRVRAFLQYLKAMAIQPDVIVFQEVMWFPMAEYLTGQLELLGYSIHESIDLRSPLNRGHIDKTTRMPVAPSGLAIFLKDSSTYELLTDQEAGNTMVGKRIEFKERIGIDLLAEKGFMWLRVKNKLTGVHRLIMTFHPQAYFRLSSSEPLACESKQVQALRAKANEQLQATTSLDAMRKAIEHVHELQFRQVQEEIERLEKLDTFDKILLAGDFNVNRWKPLPWSKEEQTVTTAITVEEGVEYKKLLSILKGFHSLPICSDSLAFSWNRVKNSFARGYGDEAPVMQMIDGCWVKEVSSGNFLNEIKSLVPGVGSCESVVRIFMHPTPELASIWSTQCWTEHVKKKRTYTRYQAIGRKQFLEAVHDFASVLYKQYENLIIDARLRQYASKLKNDPKWEAYILKLPYLKSSQLWKGIEHYKIQKTDHGYQEQVKPNEKAFWIGAPHGYRMLYDASDHFALVAFVF